MAAKKVAADVPRGQLTVEVLNAHVHLPDMTDVYVTVHVGSAVSRTKPQENTLRPEYHQTFHFNPACAFFDNGYLVMKAYNYSLTASDTLVGEVAVPYRKVLEVPSPAVRVAEFKSPDGACTAEVTYNVRSTLPPGYTPTASPVTAARMRLKEITFSPLGKFMDRCVVSPMRHVAAAAASPARHVAAAAASPVRHVAAAAASPVRRHAPRPPPTLSSLAPAPPSPRTPAGAAPAESQDEPNHDGTSSEEEERGWGSQLLGTLGLVVGVMGALWGVHPYYVQLRRHLFGGKRYTVKKGEWLTEIARREKLPPNALVIKEISDKNNIANSNYLKPGQRILLP